MNAQDRVPALVVDGLSVSHGAQALVRDVSFAIPAGGVLTLLGESGSGKSLLAQAIMGNLPAGLRCAGTIAIGGERTGAADQRSRHAGWGRRVALLPQEPWLALDPTMKVRRQVAETYELVSHPARGHEEDDWRSAKVNARTLADRALASLGLGDAADKYPFMISGGMAQRVAFLATHAAGAPLMIVDEPTKGLDADRRGEVAGLLRAARARGISLLCITHDIWLARAIGGELGVMLDGEMIERGDTADVLAAPKHDYTRRLVAADPANWSARPAAAGAPQRRIVATIDGVGKSFGSQRLFDGIGAHIEVGEIVAVTGPSGSGKTTFGNIVLGLLKPDAGRVTRATGLAPAAFQKIYQDPAAAFAPRASLRRSLMDLVRLHRLDWNVLDGLLARMRLAPALLDRLPGQVSGGELQRIALARVLLMKPALIFADEPTSRLDPVMQQEVVSLLADHARENACAVLLVTHDAEIVQAVADRRIDLQS
ncbi:ABC transporter ATP-binding protein [Pseudoduganella umbonata]|uniref:ABC transporter ATP-binding protein n=1 Tax=Pseudoduganella umbonata TaxID=864828 RepID=A0A4P8HRG2_9BURK|nr:ATP-binding cassette domain-containing protein [Pseudoduganella umbonata]MBB3224434.1 peptide/nickel transport system ATP-binding protein [Pseudoduganella umbonata]QCP11208.1 ABC transporter ATP-binding protein [Pseudoduganella umbonata]